MIENSPPPLPPQDESLPERDRYDVKRRLAFLSLSDADAEQLRSLAPLFEKHAREFVDQFYRHLFHFPQTARFLHDEKLVARLKEMQLAHLQSMLHAAWGDDYVTQRRRVGSVHAEKGIEPEFFLGSYQLYLSYYMELLEQECAGDTQRFIVQMRSLVKAVMLDVGLTLDAYFSKLTDDLRKALDMYWRANTELRNFAQLASHDLKTPLATVANLCDEALDEFRDQMPAEACDLVERAKQRSYRMSRMIDELLAAAITQPGADQLAPVALAEVMADVLDRLHGPLLEKNVQLQQPDQWPFVLANRPRLCEVFYNLLANAVKFMDKQPAKIILAVREVDGETLITLTDNGPGIPEEELEGVFNPFRRLAQHRGLPGSGLGLYFTKNLVEQQGGRVWAELSAEGGARFHVALRGAPAEQ
jgi:signal transduction histidine kinase